MLMQLHFVTIIAKSGDWTSLHAILLSFAHRRSCLALFTISIMQRTTNHKRLRRRKSKLIPTIDGPPSHSRVGWFVSHAILYLCAFSTQLRYRNNTHTQSN
ncbi:hypothetical protein CNBG_5530 [Cryptococcus deuterogattii R265]|uniref:uncharacterized protein n=1 Tax=Cryptococcus deuterogattii (strain R265) TaxID=294750 RepID=UPI0019379B70|nr:hypothetical protein CNBG_5530 [Cryptococcus deuterogattii R265]